MKVGLVPVALFWKTHLHKSGEQKKQREAEERDESLANRDVAETRRTGARRADDEDAVDA